MQTNVSPPNDDTCVHLLPPEGVQQHDLNFTLQRAQTRCHCNNKTFEIKSLKCGCMLHVESHYGSNCTDNEFLVFKHVSKM